ncbi:O-antigen ligase family protein [Sphingobium aromaticiconvertens]|uniref:O-antigen ligase family protein n=1 Tax=Sphingobium aromaticiconvertens TaxID=365341 RepID=UPI003017DC46
MAKSIAQRGGSRLYSSEMIFACIAVAFASGGLDLLVTNSTGVVERMSSGSSSWTARLLAFPAYLYVFYAILMNPRRYWSGLMATGWLGVLILMAAASTVWSMAPIDTLIRAVLLLAISMFSVALAVRFPRDQLLLVLGGGLLITFLAGMVALVVAPSIAQHQDSLKPAIRGLFLQKNITGRTYVIGVLIGLALMWSRRAVMLGRIMTACFMAGIFLSLSASALLNMIWAIAFLPLVALYRRSPRMGFLVTVLLIAFAVLFVMSGAFDYLYTETLAALGKDPTLTNRTFIWEKLIERLREGGWILGYGYDGFWNSPNGAVLTFDARYFVPGHAHNGLIQTIVAFGVIGGGLLIIAYAVLLVQKIRLTSNNPDRLASFDLTYVIYFFLANMTEQSVMEYQSMLWITLVTVACLPNDKINPSRRPLMGRAPNLKAAAQGRPDDSPEFLA